MNICGATALIICVITGFFFFKVYSEKRMEQGKKILFSTGTIMLFAFIFFSLATILSLGKAGELTELFARSTLIICSISTAGSLIATFGIIVLVGFVGK